MPPTESVDVVVVGGGASGLAAAAALQRRGLQPVVLERDERIGGTWARRYERLHLHTVRRFSGLPYRPLSRRLPRYVAKDDYARYLEEYAEGLGLEIVLGCEVRRIQPAGAGWALEVNGDAWAARAVVVATGRHREPRMVQWPGLETFPGRVLHSCGYHSGREFTGLRTLVVGIGNSGAEIAADLVEQGAARVAVAVRTPPPITSREILGVPTQVLGIVLAPFPPGPVDRVGAVMRRLGTGDLTKYGIGREAWGPFGAHRPPVIDVGFVDQLKRRRIDVRPDVARFDASDVVFADGGVESFDVVVAATGFTTGLERLIGLDGLLDERGLPRCSGSGASSQPGLYFIGFTETPRGQLFEASRAAPRLAATVSGFVGNGAR